jgi:hypothetical protein
VVHSLAATSTGSLWHHSFIPIICNLQWSQGKDRRIHRHPQHSCHLVGKRSNTVHLSNWSSAVQIKGLILFYYLRAVPWQAVYSVLSLGSKKLPDGLIYLEPLTVLQTGIFDPRSKLPGFQMPGPSTHTCIQNEEARGKAQNWDLFDAQVMWREEAQ